MDDLARAGKGPAYPTVSVGLTTVDGDLVGEGEVVLGA